MPRKALPKFDTTNPDEFAGRRLHYDHPGKLHRSLDTAAPDANSAVGALYNLFIQFKS